MYVNIHDNFHVGLYDTMASTKHENWVKCGIELQVVAGQCPTWFFLKRDYYTWIVINVLIVFIGKNCDVMVRSHALNLKVQSLILFVIFFSSTNEKEDTILDPLLQASRVKKRNCNYFWKWRTWKPQPSCVRKIYKSHLGKVCNFFQLFIHWETFCPYYIIICFQFSSILCNISQWKFEENCCIKGKKRLSCFWIWKLKYSKWQAKKNHLINLNKLIWVCHYDYNGLF